MGHLREYHNRLSQLAERSFLFDDRFHQLDRCKYPVTGGGILAEYDMPRLLTAYYVTVLRHIFVYVFVTDRSLLIFNSRLAQCAVQSHIGHNGSDDLVVDQPPLVLECLAENVDYVVAVDLVAVFINRDTAVGVTVVSKAGIKVIFDHKTAQSFDMS